MDQKIKILRELLQHSRILNETQWAEAEGCEQQSPIDLAQEWVKRKLITSWQAEQLLAGKASFFMGKYKLLDKLGEGGMGAVYKAEQTGMRRIVALKVVNEDALNQQGAVSRFQREIQAIAALTSPHIIAALDADSEGDRHFLIMEYIEGRDLKSYIKESKILPFRWSCDVIRQAALGLQHAFLADIVHRDIKPSNLFLQCHDAEQTPLVKILDFGLARFSHAAQGTMVTQTGQVLGTIDYISPEQARDTKGVGVQADIYSLGCTLFHCVTGRVPFVGRNPMEKLMARAFQDPPPASTVNPNVPPLLDQMLAKMLARDVKCRYQTPAEVAEDLTAFLHDEHHLPHLSAPVVSTPVPNAPPFTPSVDSTLQDFLTDVGTPTVAASVDTLEATSDRSSGTTFRFWPSLIVGACLCLGLVVVIPLLFQVPDPLTLSLSPPEEPPPSTNLPQKLPDKLPPTKETPTKPPPSKPPPAVAIPIEDSWLAEVGNLTAEQQVQAVVAKLQELNPKYNGKVEFKIDDAGQVNHLAFSTQHVADIRPVQALRHLTSLSIGTGDGRSGPHGSLQDLTPLVGMSLKRLYIHDTKVRDLEPLRNMPLESVNCGETLVKSVEPLSGMRLTEFGCNHTAISDLSPLANAPLEKLWIQGCPFEDLSYLEKCPIKHILLFHNHKLQRLAFDWRRISPGSD